MALFFNYGKTLGLVMFFYELFRRSDGINIQKKEVLIVSWKKKKISTQNN